MFYDRFLGYLLVFAVAVCGLGLLQVEAEPAAPRREAVPSWAEDNPGLLLQVAGGVLTLIGVGGRLCQRWELSRGAAPLSV